VDFSGRTRRFRAAAPASIFCIEFACNQWTFSKERSHCVRFSRRPSRFFWGAFLLLIGGCGDPSSESESDSARPNVLFSLADDLGYVDIGAYNPGTFYETPHVDSLAESGLMFTNGYAANPVGSPTRASIMTGRNPSRENHTDWFCGGRTERFDHAEYDCSLAPSQETLGERGKEEMVIIGAAMRKLLHICYGVLKSGRPFDASLHPTT